jgi:hypothetical protein
MKTYTLTASILGALLLAGCGSDATEGYTDITVERGPVLMANVVDAKGQRGEDLGNGVYRFTSPEYPIKSHGGFIDMNRNGEVDEGDLSMTQLHLQTGNGNVMTMATTMAQNTKLHTYMKDLGLSDEELLEMTPSMDKDTAALSDEMYKYCIENNISDPSMVQLAEMDAIREKIQNRRERYNNSGLSAAQHEYQLINDEMNTETLNTDDAKEIIQTSIENAEKQIIVNETISENLSNEQKYTLAYMWNEEKLAKDIYLELNKIHPSNTLYNIATKAETKHQASVEGLIEKYDLNILNPTDYEEHYLAAELAVYAPGEYSINTIQSLYDTLYAKGSQSLQDALEVGCMVEVTDIEDLVDDLVVDQNAPDLVIVFENLLAGSYAHYWSFNTALQNMGVSEGCCVLGEDFCKTSEEYPQGTTGSQQAGKGQQGGNGQQGGRR